ncbi:hypothetical protein D9M70_616230 [compost metagenome]
MNLQNWVREARQHWKEFQPSRYKELKKAGQLEQALQQAAQQTYLELSQLEASGYNQHESWEQVRELYLFPLEEEGLVDEDEVAGQGPALFNEAMQIIQPYSEGKEPWNREPNPEDL